MEPDEIDLTFVPGHRAGLATIPCGDELLIVAGDTDLPHLLNPTATLVWSFIDGTGSLGEFASDLVDVLGAAPADVERDLVELARDLGRRGLLDGVGPATGATSPAGESVLAAPPNAALDERFAGPGSRTVTVRDGTVELAARVDDPDLAADLLAALLGGGLDGVLETDVARSGTDASPIPLYSLLGGRRAGPVEGLQLLYRSGAFLRRCRRKADMVRIAVADVAAVLDRQTGRKALLDVVGLERDGRLVAVDPVFAAVVSDLEPGLRREGIERLDASFVALPPGEGGPTLAGLVLRPAATGTGGAGSTPAAVALAAVDLARGVDRHVSADSLASLCAVVAATTVRRVPGREALRTAVIDLLAAPT